MTRVMLLIPTASWRAVDFMAAAERLQLDVVVASDIDQPLADMFPGRWLTLPYHDASRGAQAVARYADRFPLDAVVAVDDPGIHLAALASEALSLPANGADAVLATRDKSVLRERLSASDAPSPAWSVARFNDAIEQTVKVVESQLGWPVVIKPLALNGSRGVMRVDDAAALERAARRLERLLNSASVREECADSVDRYLIEQYIPGAEVALEGLLRNGRLHTLALFDKPDPLEGPFFEETIYVTPSRLPGSEQALISSTAQQAVEALGLRDGPLHAELRLNAAGAWPIDVAARTIGGLCARTLSFGAGMTLEEIVLRHAVDAPLRSLNRETQAAGVMMIPVPQAGRLRAVKGLTEACAIDKIESIQIEARIGDCLIPLPESSNYPGFIFARADTPSEVEQALRRAHSLLRFEFA